LFSGLPTFTLYKRGYPTKVLPSNHVSWALHICDLCAIGHIRNSVPREGTHELCVPRGNCFNNVPAVVKIRVEGRGAERRVGVVSCFMA
jgi:hypothetical protein